MQKGRYYILIIVCLFTCLCNINSQNLSAYTDYMGRFYTFDKGEMTIIEDIKPEAYKVGGKHIAYLSHSGRLKVYENGVVKEIEPPGVSGFDAKDNFVVYNVHSGLAVYYNGQRQILSRWCSYYISSETMVLFYDKFTETLKVFSEGLVQEIESGLIGQPISSGAIGKNTIAYISSMGHDFKIWYNGQLTTVDNNVPGTRFKAGKNIVAFVDESTQSFKTFYKGEIIDLEAFPPSKFKVGNDFVAYVSADSEFKVFYKNNIFSVSSFQPESFMAKDDLLVYSENGYLMLWQDNNITELESFVPSLYDISWSTLVYSDLTNRLWMYNNGEKKFLTNKLIESFNVNRNLITIHLRSNSSLFYYNNKLIESKSMYR